MIDIVMTVIILGSYIVLQNYLPWTIALLISLITGVFAHDVFFIAKLKLNNKEYNKRK